MGNGESHIINDPSSANTEHTSGYTEFIQSAGKTISNASGIVCGSLNDAYEDTYVKGAPNRRMNDSMSLNSQRTPARSDGGFSHPESEEDFLTTGSIKSNNGRGQKRDNTNQMSAIFARALVSEVTDNPSTMTPSEMAQREKKIMRAQEKAKIKNASRTVAPNQLAENRAQVRQPGSSLSTPNASSSKHRITIGLSLSRRHVTLGHPDTVTRQTAFDFNELQDRDYKYVSSTDASGWRAGGGEGGNTEELKTLSSSSDEKESKKTIGSSQQHKVAAADTVHIPIMHIDCMSPAQIDLIIAALARGEVFIPHMSIIPTSVGVDGISPPDLVVRFSCERNEDLPPEQWPNWCLEFMHNQLYDFFSPVLGTTSGTDGGVSKFGGDKNGGFGVKWAPRPFQITLARKVRWKTVKHMNRFFSQSERVVQAWREKGPKCLDPQLTYIEGGATPEEVARPHGIYLLRNGRPTNYFPPNFEPPYTTKMTRSLLLNVMGKSWDRKRRDWASEPIPKAVSAGLLLSTMCGCSDSNDTGFIASEVTKRGGYQSIDSGVFFGHGSNFEKDLSDRALKQKKVLDEMTMDSMKNNETFPGAIDTSSPEKAVDKDRPKSSSSARKQRNTKKKNEQDMDAVNTTSNPSDQSGSASISINPVPSASSQLDAEQNFRGDPDNSFGSLATESSSKKSEPQRGESEPPQPTLTLSESEPVSEHETGYDLPEAQDPQIQPQWNDSQFQPQSQIKPQQHELQFQPQSLPQQQESQLQLQSQPKHEQNEEQLQPNVQPQLESQSLPQFKTEEVTSSPPTDMLEKKNEDTRFASSHHHFRQHNPVISERIPEDAEADHRHHMNISNSEVVATNEFQYYPTTASANITQPVEEDATHSVSTGEIGGLSVGESQTTVPTMNGSSSKFIEQERERRKQREKERERERKKIDELEMAIQEKLQNSVGRIKNRRSKLFESDAIEDERSQRDNSTKDKSSRKSKKKKKKRRDKGNPNRHEDLDQPLLTLSHPESSRNTQSTRLNKSRQNESLEANEQQQEVLMPLREADDRNIRKGMEDWRDSSLGVNKPLRDSSYFPLNLKSQAVSAPGQSSSKKVYGDSPTRNVRSPDLASQISMDYSMDTASLMGDGSLLGGKFASDGGSVITLNTNASENRSLLSCVTRSTIHEGHECHNGGGNKTSAPISEEDVDDISLSLLASSSSGLDIPTDEELFAIGWAKAMDPTSKTYYYFTLDRTKTVWDNPLASP